MNDNGEQNQCEYNLIVIRETTEFPHIMKSMQWMSIWSNKINCHSKTIRREIDVEGSFEMHIFR